MPMDEPEPLEMHPLTGWEDFEPIGFCQSMERVMAENPNEEGFAVALDRESLVKMIECLRRGAAQ